MAGKAKTIDAAGDDALAGPASGDLFGGELHPSDPAVTGIPRDELHDSYEPYTGGITEEARKLRLERGITAGGQQAGD